jgi:hypothetical protein
MPYIPPPPPPPAPPTLANPSVQQAGMSQLRKGQLGLYSTIMTNPAGLPNTNPVGQESLIGGKQQLGQ